MVTYNEWVAQQIKETKDFHGVSKWHTMGFRGQGVNVLNLESYSNHGKNTYDTIRIIAPDSKIDSIQWGYGARADKLYHFNAVIDGRTFTLDNYEEFEQFIKKYDVITVSMSGSYPKQIEDSFVKSGAILMSSAGNEGSDGVTGRFKEVGYQVGAVYMLNGVLKKESYSAVGDEVDFACLHGHLEGTSFSCPVLAGLVALIISRYGRFTQEEMYFILKSISVDAGDEGFDDRFGWGVPVLPEQIQLIEMGEIMKFKDVDNNRWSSVAIDYVSNEGLMTGFEDGTFKPTEPLTREQMAQILYNMSKRG